MKTREWQQYPSEIPLETEIGMVYLSVTQGDHIHVDGSGNGKYVTVRGVRYSCSLHVRKYADGWHPQRSATGQRDRSALYMHKQGAYKNDQASDAAERKALSVLMAAVHIWAGAHPEAFAEGEAAHLNNELASIEGDIVHLEEQLAELKTKKADLDKRVARLVFPA